MKKTYEFIIWGLGEKYNSNINLLRFYSQSGMIKVVGLTYKDAFEGCYIDGYPIISPQRLNHLTYDYIMIMSDIYFLEISQEIYDLGIPAQKIISYKILNIPGIECPAADCGRR